MAVETLRVEPGDHIVQFYDVDGDLVASVATHLAGALEADDAAVVIATAAHRRAFARAMVRRGIDVPAARAGGRLVELDAAQTLGCFMRDGMPDPAGFDAAVGGVVRRACEGGRRARAFGEMVALLWDEGQVGAVIALEALWNRLALQLPFSLVCGYPSEVVAGEEHAAACAHMCSLHSWVVGGPRIPVSESRRSFPGTPHSARAARRFVGATLQAWGRGDLVDDAMLVSAELAANAVVHARSEFEVVLTQRNDGVVRIAVRDASAAPPVSAAAPWPVPSGRGLVLVGALSERWGHEMLEGGKLVWAEFAA